MVGFLIATEKSPPGKLRTIAHKVKKKKKLSVFLGKDFDMKTFHLRVDITTDEL